MKMNTKEFIGRHGGSFAFLRIEVEWVSEIWKVSILHSWLNRSRDY
jgi:hypothetical protein